MSAHLNTYIIMKGSSVELLAMLDILKKYETEKKDQCNKKHDCGYIYDVCVSSDIENSMIIDMDENSMKEFLLGAGNELKINASGPYGAYHEPGDVGLFEALAESAPNAFFAGKMEGYISGADVCHTGNLIDGKLYLSDYYEPFESISDLYAEYIEARLPYSEFCKIFHVDKIELTNGYGDFVEYAFEEGFPEKMDYDTFINLCDSFEITMDDFENGVKKVASLGLVDYKTFFDYVNKDEFTEKRMYDPFKKIYKIYETVITEKNNTFTAE